MCFYGFFLLLLHLNQRRKRHKYVYHQVQFFMLNRTKCEVLDLSATLCQLPYTCLHALLDDFFGIINDKCLNTIQI